MAFNQPRSEAPSIQRCPRLQHHVRRKWPRLLRRRATGPCCPPVCLGVLLRIDRDMNVGTAIGGNNQSKPNVTCHGPLTLIMHLTHRISRRRPPHPRVDALHVLLLRNGHAKDRNGPHMAEGAKARVACSRSPGSQTYTRLLPRPPDSPHPCRFL